jgi:predicted RNase H-like HicB family nuclease
LNLTLNRIQWQSKSQKKVITQVSYIGKYLSIIVDLLTCLINNTFHNSNYAIEQYAQADLLAVMLIANVCFTVRYIVSVEQKDLPAGAGSLAPPFYLKLLVNIFTDRISYLYSKANVMERRINLHIEKLPEGYYLATSDSIQGLVAQGRTIAETIEIAKDVAKKLLEAQEDQISSLKTFDDSFDYPLVIGI